MKALITGGAGFIGANLANRLCKEGWKVTVVDSLLRKGAERNLLYLKKNYPASKLKVEIVDILNPKISSLLSNQDVIFHLAAQTAVTNSIKNPFFDFEINVLGTIKLLEALRHKKARTPFIFASTNKVYGSMNNLKYLKSNRRYKLRDYPQGINESFPVDFYSPYGCSKGAADFYTHDYSRIYDIPTVVFRQSCVYGPMQFGVSDQGWLAHLGALFIMNKPINIFGDGRQVRDLLFVDDLIDAYLLAFNKINKVKGEVFNIGGGPNNALSILEYINFLEKSLGKKTKIVYKRQRPGDQKVFIADIRKAEKLLDWRPKTGYKEGLPKMLEWIKTNIEFFKKIHEK